MQSLRKKENNMSDISYIPGHLPRKVTSVIDFTDERVIQMFQL